MRGFSLLEVMIALVILAMSLSIILQANVSALASVERMEGMSQATLLARGKMLDLERELNKEGFKLDEEERDGDFEEQKHPEIKWHAHIYPIKVQTEKLMAMAQSLTGMGGDGKDGKSAPGGGGLAAVTGTAGGVAGAGGMGDITQMLLPMITPVAQGIGQNMRLAVLEVSWPEGKYRGSFKVNALITSRALKTSAQQAGLVGASGATAGVTGAPGVSGVVPTLPGVGK